MRSFRVPVFSFGLGEAQQQFAEAAGFAPDMTSVDSVAGGQSAIAVYE